MGRRGWTELAVVVAGAAGLVGWGAVAAHAQVVVDGVVYAPRGTLVPVENHVVADVTPKAAGEVRVEVSVRVRNPSPFGVVLSYPAEFGPAAGSGARHVSIGARRSAWVTATFRAESCPDGGHHVWMTSSGFEATLSALGWSGNDVTLTLPVPLRLEGPSLCD